MKPQLGLREKTMPTYRFKNTETGEEFEKFMSWNDRVKFLEENPQLTTVIGAPNIVYQPGNHIKVDNGFREVLSKVKEKYTVNNIKDY